MIIFQFYKITIFVQIFTCFAQCKSGKITTLFLRAFFQSADAASSTSVMRWVNFLVPEAPLKGYADMTNQFLSPPSVNLNSCSLPHI